MKQHMKSLYISLIALAAATLDLSCHSKASVPIVVLMPDGVTITKGKPIFDYFQKLIERRNKEAIAANKGKKDSATLIIWHLKADSAKKVTTKK